MGGKTYLDYLNDNLNSNIQNHKHMMPPEARPSSDSGMPGILSAVAYEMTPKRRIAFTKMAEERARKQPRYIKNDVIREIQKDLGLD